MPTAPQTARLSGSRPAAIIGTPPARRIAYYGALVVFLILVAGLGQIGVGASRFIFIVGSVALGWVAFKQGGLPLHVEATIVLFVFAPFLRRVIDLHVGYDPSGTMLIGPIGAIAAAFPELRRLLSPGHRLGPAFAPYLLMAACVVYGWSLSSFSGNFVESSVAAVKYLVPLLYAVCLILRPDQSDAVLAGAARAFLIVGPLIGLYGVAQHLDPQAWDRYWMVSSKIPSIGQPFPGQVRVFSTMNSPASFAAYATCGLLLFSFMPRSFIPPILVPFVAILPLCLSILLTSVRTAWLSAAVSVVFCMLFNRTRSRAGVLVVCLSLGITFALLFTSFADVISDRFATLSGNVAADGSGGERLGDYAHVFLDDDRYVFGTGLAPVEGDTRLAALDGQVLMSATQMGRTIGIVYVLGILWAGIQALVRVRQADSTLRLVAAALLVGNLVILPLTAVTIGEIGFLFWMLVGTLTVPAAILPRRASRLVEAVR